MNRKLFFIFLSGLFLHHLSAQQAQPSKVWEYCPAPGQFVHELPAYQTGDDAEIMNEKCLERLRNNAAVSLGGYGGSITVGFDHTILNIPEQKDFTVLGNAFAGSAEPGIVLVSSDANGDGIPNDEWYELAGSEYENPATIHGYKITYVRPSAEGSNVAWTDNQGRSGFIEYMGKATSTHSHPHYPEWISKDTLIFKGNCLPDNGSWDKENKKWVMKSFAYGYADNYPNNNFEGCSFDISWAVDAEGNKVNLEGIDFIRIYTGVNQQIPSGNVGELSTEVCGLKDLHLEETGVVYSTSQTFTAYYSQGKLYIPNSGLMDIGIYDAAGDLVNQSKAVDPSFGYPVTLIKGIYIVSTSKGKFKLKI